MSNALWRDSYVAELAAKTSQPGDCFGLIVVCSWPMPRLVHERYVQFAAQLSQVLPEEAYILPVETLHITVATLRSFHGPPRAV
eukprot:462178-Amphidinium_carterae.1